MDGIEKSMEIIAFGGQGKSLAMTAIQKARAGEFEEAEALMKEAHEAIVKCHQSHSELLFYDAENQDLKFSCCRSSDQRRYDRGYGRGNY